MEAPETATAAIVGRGVREGTRLFREWFVELTRLAEAGEGAAYVFVPGSMAEILRTFDLPVTYPEVNSLNTAIRHVSRDYLDAAEDYGYSPDICGYVKADVGLHLRQGRHPMGRVPRPAAGRAPQPAPTFQRKTHVRGRAGVEQRLSRRSPRPPVFDHRAARRGAEVMEERLGRDAAEIVLIKRPLLI